MFLSLSSLNSAFHLPFITSGGTYNSLLKKNEPNNILNKSALTLPLGYLLAFYHLPWAFGILILFLLNFTHLKKPLLFLLPSFPNVSTFWAPTFLMFFSSGLLYLFALCGLTFFPFFFLSAFSTLH